jgi:hypothetical protein
MNFVKAAVGFGEKAALDVNNTEVVETLNVDWVELEDSLVALRGRERRNN